MFSIHSVENTEKQGFTCCRLMFANCECLQMKYEIQLQFKPTTLKWGIKLSQIENHYDEVSNIETELRRHMIALGLDWQNEVSMMQLAVECKAFKSSHAQAAFASHDRVQKTKAEIFALASLMLRTMENAAGENREVHAGEVWKSFGKHLYEDFPLK
jgi:hypothetical protein